MRALVVDDSSAMRAILKMLLKQSGFEVLEARDGKDALAVLEQNGVPEVGLFDWNMPNMTGFELVKAVRARREFDSMRVMMVTTETEMAHVHEALAAGADEYIMKPFSREVVADKLRLLGF